MKRLEPFEGSGLIFFNYTSTLYNVDQRRIVGNLKDGINNFI